MWVDHVGMTCIYYYYYVTVYFLYNYIYNVQRCGFVVMVLYSLMVCDQYMYRAVDCASQIAE